MAITVGDVTIISVTAVGANLITSRIPSESRDTIRIIEIVGGLLTAQIAKRANTKAAGAGIMVGALVGYVNDLLGISAITKRVEVYQKTQSLPVFYNTGQTRNNIYSESYII
jgi:hypothetical protein